MIKSYKNADALPSCWDSIAGDNYFIKTESLKILEKSNQCSATYYIVDNESIFVSYKISLNLLTYSKLSLNKNVTVIGVPLSVGAPGYVLTKQEHLYEILKIIKGFVVVLNTYNPIENLAYGKTLPDLEMKVPKSEVDYIDSLKSNYRKRVNRIKQSMFEIEEIKPIYFPEALYKKYEEVYEKSQFKLEKQSISFFKEYDSEIFTFKKNNEYCGFLQTKVINKKMYFILGGFEYKKNKDNLLYTSMLYKVIVEAINKKCEYVVLGQTAEEAKSRFGALKKDRYMNIYHKNKMILAAVKRLIKLFEYRENNIKHEIYKR